MQLVAASDIISLVKTIKYTRHARNRMRLHGITEDDVESAIEKPAYLEPSIAGRLNAWLEMAGKFLRITYREEGNRFSIISAVKKRKGWR